MSFYRLRQLAGLTESIADDPVINQEIERRLDSLPDATRGPALDALELLKDAGPNGLLLQVWADKIRELHDLDTMGMLLKTVVQTFPNVVSKVARGHYVWTIARSSDDEVIDADQQAALGSQVALTSRAFAHMRRHPGPFTADWLAGALSNGLEPVPLAVARPFVDHLLTQFASMLLRHQGPGGDTYTLKPETPQTRDATMAQFRDLAAKPPTPK